MKHRLIAFLLIISFTFGMARHEASAEPFGDGLAAAERGDFATALRLWQPLAAQGNAAAQFNLGIMYAYGKGVGQDFKEAMKWYRLAAAQGDAGAQTNLGVMYDNGQGIAQDFKEAMKWYRLAADQGNADAQFNLGIMYDNGQGVAQDYARAHMWFNLGASGNSKNAASNRDNIAKIMTPAQIERAQDMARKCQASNFKNCD